MIFRKLKNFFELEAATAILLCVATFAALLVVNSSLAEIYTTTLKIRLPLVIDFLHVEKNLSLKDWINDALMALFFFLIGLELKKEILVGELNSVKKNHSSCFCCLWWCDYSGINFLCL